MNRPAIQLRFDWVPLVEPKHVGKWLSIDQRFKAFHAANPHICLYLREMALQYQAAGNQRCSIKMLWEVLRFDSAVQTAGEPYKLNNNFTALYARLLMDQEPTLAGFFETRERSAWGGDRCVGA